MIFVVLSMISCLLSEPQMPLSHNLRSTEIHPRITFQRFIYFPLIKLSATYIFHICLLRNLSYHLFHVIIVDTLSAMYQFDPFLPILFWKSYNNLALETVGIIIISTNTWTNTYKSFSLYLSEFKASFSIFKLKYSWFTNIALVSVVNLNCLRNNCVTFDQIA